MNYWAPTDGRIDAFEDDPRTSSEVIQDFLAGADVVKTLNHIGYHELESDGRPAGDADRRALALAGDSDRAKARVAGFLDRMGYDPLDAGALAAGRAFQPGTQIFNGPTPPSSSSAAQRSSGSCDRLTIARVAPCVRPDLSTTLFRPAHRPSPHSSHHPLGDTMEIGAYSFGDSSGTLTARCAPARRR